MEPYLLSLLTFCLGLFLGHRLSLWRDRRKEFNDIAQPIREVLLKERKNPSPHFAGVGEIDADRLACVLHWWQRQRFRRVWNEYRKVKEQSIVQDPVYGSCSFENTDEISKHVARVLRYTDRK